MIHFPHQLIPDFERWPHAVPPEAVPKTPGDWDRRSSAIIDLLVPVPVAGIKALDLGCGFGLVARELAARGAVAHASDANYHDIGSWPGVTTIPPHRLPDDHYDLVLLIDVIDHAPDPVALMLRASRALTKGGTIVLRCHPYLSRHGGHQHLDTNRAFAHLVTDLPHETGNPLRDPEDAYRSWAEDAGLEVASHAPTTTPVEPFFYRHFPEEMDQHAPESVLQQSFHDFTLVRR